MGRWGRYAIGGGMVLALGVSQGAAAQCKSAKPPPTLFSTVLSSPAFRPREILDPLLELRIDPQLAAASRYRIEYFDPVDPGAAAPTASVDVDPASVQMLVEGRSDGKAEDQEDKSRRKFLDLRAVPLLDGYRQARVVLDVPSVDVETPVLRAAALVRALGSLKRGVDKYTKDPAFGGDVVALALADRKAAERVGLPLDQAERLEDALVLIVLHKSDGDELCNGALIGGGRVLTAGHCLSSKMSVLMGRAWVNGGGFAAELSCPGKISASQTTIRDELGLPMDIGIVELPPGFGASVQGARFARIALPIARQAAAPKSFRMAATWTVGRQRTGFTSDREVYVSEYLAKQFFKPPVGGSLAAHAWCQAPAPTEVKTCLKQPGRRSSDGWRHRCPSERGLSGAPLFDGESQDLAVIAVNTGEGVRPDNCATAASTLPTLD